MYNQKEKEYNWNNKEERAEMARLHTAEMTDNWPDGIKNSIIKSRIYNETYQFKKKKHFADMQIRIENKDTVSAMIDEFDEYQEKYSDSCKIAALNFASYKNPGGMFMKGSRTQEECLCHESYLYNVLSDYTFSDYYKDNNFNTNKSLYLNRAIYSPLVLFRNSVYCDVLTCAAPNYTAAAKYNKVSKEDNSKCLKDRIRFVLSCFEESPCEIIVLGAFGCGVFGQDAEEVARIFKELLSTDFRHSFKEVIFAIPSGNENYGKFVKVFN